MCGRSFHISSRSDSYLSSSCEFVDKTLQMAEEQLVMTMDKVQETRLQRYKSCFLMTSAKAKKFKDGDRSITLYSTISLQLRRFSKIAAIFFKLKGGTHILSSNGFNKKRNEAFSKITGCTYSTHTHTHTHTHIELFVFISCELQLISISFCGKNIIDYNNIYGP